MPEFPCLRDVGLCGLLVSFAATMDDAANRAALAFRAAVDSEALDGIEESSTTLASAFFRYDPLRLPRDVLAAHLQSLLDRQDWTRAPLPQGRTHWCIPTALGGTDGPQFEEAAALAGLDPDTAAQEITSARLRVLTIGFAPGQPYLGQLPPHWNIPRMSSLNPQVPGASLVVAIRQLIVFAGPAPTGWRHIGQTAFRCFRPGGAEAIALKVGDEVSFRRIDHAELAEIAASDTTGDGGAAREALS